MGFPESVLTKDEQVVLHLHPHWKALFLPVVWAVLAVAAVAAAAIFTSWNAIVLLILAGVALVVLLVVTVWPWIKWKTTHYVFTNERVIMRSGVFSRSGRDIPLGRINDVSFSHSLFERMLGCGTLTIESAGERGQVQLTDLPHVEKTQSTLYELVDADRQKHTFGDDDREALVKEIKHD
ncbi:PH domain-containing protein [Dactylosporangium sp. NPDC048998]|uniref:PH domain-containing protein n=1 Tax=Dactylosporangium sp. NPDC048998 TaxID=3363976 RepID=UPI00371C7D20